MFSDCNSSRVSSVDSYRTKSDIASSMGPPGMDGILGELSDSLEESTVASFLSEHYSSHSLIPSLSSSSDFPTKGNKDREKSMRKSKSVKDLKASCTMPVDKPSKPTKPRRTRSAMGSYIPPTGGLPLTRSYFSSPGPGAYYPDISAVKRNAPQYLLKFRQKIRQEETVGPGPAYMVTKQCCPDTYNECHFSKRFQEITSAGPGPGAFDLNEYNGIGRFKPKAMILSRRPVKSAISGNAFQNTCGLTRFGPTSSPNVLVISKPIQIDKNQPGPGSYNPGNLRDRRIQIKMRGKWKWNHGIDMNIPGPKYMLKSTLKGPAWPLVGKWKARPANIDSPGPIYKPLGERKKPVTMTFLPFPMRGKESEPGPLNYDRVGEQTLNTKRNAPKALIVSRKNPDFGFLRMPGPNHYLPPSKIGFSSYNEVSMKGRWKFISTVSPGPGAYKLPACPPNCKRSPNAVFAGKYERKPRGERSPGFVYTPKLDKGTVRNVFLAPRWPPIKKASDSVKFYDLTGFTQRGKVNRIPISLKSRPTPFVYNGTSTNPTIPAVDRCNIESLKYDSPSAAV